MRRAVNVAACDVFPSESCTSSTQSPRVAPIKFDAASAIPAFGVTMAEIVEPGTSAGISTVNCPPFAAKKPPVPTEELVPPIGFAKISTVASPPPS